MKKAIAVCCVLSFFLMPSIVQAEISQEEQQRAAQRAYEASASSYNSVASAPARAAAQVKKATSRHQSSGAGSTAAVRG